MICLESWMPGCQLSGPLVTTGLYLLCAESVWLQFSVGVELKFIQSYNIEEIDR